MNSIEEFVDERQKGWCLHCGGSLDGLETNRDHIPSRGLLVKPYPSNLPRVMVCKICNEGFSLDEEYLIAFLSCVLSGSTEPDRQKLSTAERILRRSAKLKAKIADARSEQTSLDGRTQIVWKPETDRINRIVVKNARGHAFFEYGEPMLRAPQHVWSEPLDSLTSEYRATFEEVGVGNGWPEVGSRMMARLMTGQDLSDSWVVVQEGIYRYGVVQQDVMLVRSVLFEYLATEVYWS